VETDICMLYCRRERSTWSNGKKKKLHYKRKKRNKQIKLLLFQSWTFLLIWYCHGM